MQNGMYNDLDYVGFNHSDCSRNISRRLFRFLKSTGMIARAFQAKARLAEMNIGPDVGAQPSKGGFTVWSEIRVLRRLCLH